MSFDVIVIGGGIAGASLGAALSETRRVLVLEQESQPGYHSTGRSAALFSEAYGGSAIRALSRASRSFLFEPPSGFADAPLVRSRGTLLIADQAQSETLFRLEAESDLGSVTQRVGAAAAHAICPILSMETLFGALFEPDSADVDVHGLHQGYIRQLRGRGGVVQCDAKVLGLQAGPGGWRVETTQGRYEAEVVVNAAGAWADEIAWMAGVAPIDLQPLRRTALLTDPPPGCVIDDWPLVMDVEEQFYFKPDAGKLLISPADESPCEPHDVQPEEWDVAVAVDRVERATTLQVSQISHRWAGLRSFVPDRRPVVGFDTAAPGFFWAAAQGGYGIQTAPGLAETAAALIQNRPLPARIVDCGVDLADISPARLRA
jgi:D-arginine dehydrogenase